jgi:hypothetical protein
MNLLNLVQFIQLPFAIIPLLKVYSSAEIMSGYTISKFKLIFVILLSIMIQVFNIFSVYFVLEDSAKVWKVIVWILISCHTIFISRFAIFINLKVFFSYLKIRNIKTENLIYQTIEETQTFISSNEEEEEKEEKEEKEGKGEEKYSSNE